MTVRTGLVAALAAGLCLLVAGCRSDSGGASPTTRPRPLDTLVPAVALTSMNITRTDGSGSADVTDADVHRFYTPLLAARTITDPEPLSAYGLDRPVAIITIDSGQSTLALLVGSANFDGTGYYVSRPGDRRVYLVLADAVRPLLDLVGLRPPAPPPR